MSGAFLLNLAAWIMGTALVLDVGIIIYLLNDPFSLIYDEDPAPRTYDGAGIETDQFHAGDIVYVERTLCRHDERSAFVFPRLISNRVIALPEYTAVFPAGCYTRRYPFLLPADLQPGNHTLEVVLEYQANPLKRQQYKFVPVHLRIVRKDSVPW